MRRDDRQLTRREACIAWAFAGAVFFILHMADRIAFGLYATGVLE